jgi:hypothetical protein
MFDESYNVKARGLLAQQQQRSAAQRKQPLVCSCDARACAPAPDRARSRRIRPPRR